jgi:hypothetical protein
MGIFDLESANMKVFPLLFKSGEQLKRFIEAFTD